MEVDEVSQNVFHVKMNSTKFLCKTFMRFQEHYESPYPQIRNKIFTRKEYAKIYQEDRKADTFTYYTDWSGFNIPSYVLNPFYAGKFDPLLKCEEKLLDTFRPYQHKKFYVIGTDKNIKFYTMLHELSHAYWYTAKGYKKKQREVLNTIPERNRKRINKHLAHLGYCKEVWEDETCAYALTNVDYLDKFKISKKVVNALRENFNVISLYKMAPMMHGKS